MPKKRPSRETAAEQKLASIVAANPGGGFGRRLAAVVKDWLRELGVESVADDKLMADFVQRARDRGESLPHR